MATQPTPPLKICRWCGGSGLVENFPNCRCTSVCTCTHDRPCHACHGTGYANALDLIDAGLIQVNP